VFNQAAGGAQIFRALNLTDLDYPVLHHEFPGFAVPVAAGRHWPEITTNTCLSCPDRWPASDFVAKRSCARSPCRVVPLKPRLPTRPYRCKWENLIMAMRGADAPVRSCPLSRCLDAENRSPSPELFCAARELRTPVSPRFEGFRLCHKNRLLLGENALLSKSRPRLPRSRPLSQLERLMPEFSRRFFIQHSPNWLLTRSQFRPPAGH